MVVLSFNSTTVRRGVSKYRRKVLGRNAYLAVTSAGELLHGAVYVVTEKIGDAALVVWLKTELDRIDPPKGRHLTIVPRTSASTDAAFVRTAAARIEQASASLVERRQETDRVWFRATYPEGHIMRGVCERLSRLSDQSA